MTVIEFLQEQTAGFSAKEIKDFEYDLEDLLETICQEQCEKEGHYPDDDHCGRPEHRFCRTCFKAMPNAEIPARQGKVNEPVASTATLPSESLGSGSKPFWKRWFNW